MFKYYTVYIMKNYILYQLKEIKRELIDSITGLSSNDLISFSPSKHWPIAWVVLHCLRNVDKWLISNITGEFVLKHDEIFEAWPPEKPKEDYLYPDLIELTKRITIIFGKVIECVNNLEENDLLNNFTAKEPLKTSCLRVINHANSHLRNIWYILGEMKIDKWSKQKTWIPED